MVKYFTVMYANLFSSILDHCNQFGNKSFYEDRLFPFDCLYKHKSLLVYMEHTGRLSTQKCVI